MEKITPDEFFDNFDPKKVGRPRSNPKRHIPKIRRKVSQNYSAEEQIAKFKRLAYQMQKEQNFICDKTTSEAALYEIGVKTGVDRLIKLMERQLNG